MAYDEMGNYTGGDEQSYAPVEPVAPEQSPNSYDPFGNPVYSESEEERRKREEEARQKAADEADNTVAQKHEVTTYANGSKTVKSTQEIPAGQVAGPVRPGQESAINRAPMDPNQAYTAQMESGNNPNIGLHQPGKGTAYGTYGITAPAYADIQKANPKFAGRAISDLTPAEQGEAFQTLQAVNQQQLSRQGVAPTPENARLAHFLGATGAANYLKTGQISPQAAAANGGLQKALQIAQQRLAGTSGPGYGERAMAAVGRGVNAIMPSAQAGEVPQQPAGAGRGNYGMPQAQPGEGVQVATGYGVQGTSGPVNPEQAYPDDSVINDQVAQNEQRQQAQQASSKYSLATGTGEPGLRGGTASTGATDEGGYTPTQQGVRAYQDAQDNPQALMKLGTSDDPTVPDFIKDRARNRAADLIQDQRETKKAQDALQTMGPTEMAKYLSSKKTDETSTRVRGMLYAVFGNKEMAQRELDKLPGNAKDTYTVGPDGKTPLLLQQNSRGEYVSGYNAETGAKLSDKELVAAGAGVTGKVNTSMTLGFDKAGNTISHSTSPTGQMIWKNETTGQRLPGAPEGYHTGKDQRSALGDQSFKQSMSADESENRKQQAAGLKPMYTPEQIQARAQAKRDAVIGIGGAAPAAMPGQANPAPAAPPAATNKLEPVVPEKSAPAASVATPAVPEKTGTPLPDDLETQAQAIARGDVKMPTGMGASNRRNQAINNRVFEINSKYDPTIYENRAKTENAFTTGKQGDVVRSMNVSVDHLDSLQQAANELKNGQTPLFNDISQRYAQATGQAAPKNFDALKTLVGSEVAKAIQGGATALGDREEIRQEISRTGSPQQLAGVIDKYQHLLAGQMGGLKTQYTAGGGTRWDNKVNPRTKEIMDKIAAEQNANRPAGGLPAAYEDKSKEQRYQDYLKKRSQGQ